MKHYGYRYTNSLFEYKHEWAMCTTDYKKQWPSGKIPPPLTRRALGVMTITSASQARKLTCEMCGKTLFDAMRGKAETETETAKRRYVLDLTVYVDASSVGEAADKITALLYAAVSDGKIVDYRARNQPHIDNGE